MSPIMDFDMNYLTPYALFGLISFIGFKLFQKFQHYQMLRRWSQNSKLHHKDVVILHCFQRGTTIPNLLPLNLKLETYLRMANISYITDTKDYIGPNGQSPWISYNGENIGDSQIIAEFLSKKLDKPLNASYTDEELAVGTLARVAIEEHLFLGLGLWAFFHDPEWAISNKLKLSWLGLKTIACNTWQQSKAHGIGKHTAQDIQQLIMKDLRAVSLVLGKNKYFLGDQPCAECDPTMFGFLAQIIWGLASDSPYHKLVKTELHNIEEYCIRMKEKFYSDWDLILDK